MIICVSLNTALDRVYDIPNFTVGGRFRVQTVREMAGGKGLNVARVAHQLGGDVLAVGFAAGHTGRRIEDLAKADGVRTAFVHIPGESRQCHTFVHQGSESTEVNEMGPTVTAEGVEALIALVREKVSPGDVVCMSGSVPPGVPRNIYAHLIREVRSRGGFPLLDSSADAFVLGLEAVPYAIKPNRPELEEYLGRAITLAELPEVALSFHERGIEWVLISLGEDGMVAAVGGAVWRVEVPEVQAVTPVGSGDSFVGGWATTLDRWKQREGFSDEMVVEALKRGSAAGVSNAMRLETGMVDPKQVEALMEQVRVHKL